MLLLLKVLTAPNSEHMHKHVCESVDTKNITSWMDSSKKKKMKTSFDVHDVNKSYINNCPTRCNTKQSIYYSASSLYMFRVPTTPTIRSTQNCNYSLRYWSYFLCSYLPPTWLSLVTLEGGSCTVPEAVVTVLCTPDGGCGWHPKHVQWTCRIINRLLCVASRWTIINTDQRYTEP